MSDNQLRETVFDAACNVVEQLTRIADLLEERLPAVKAEPATKAETQRPSIEPMREAVELTPLMARVLTDRLVHCPKVQEVKAIQRWLAENELRLVRETPSKAETPTDTASEDEIMGREFDSLRPGDVIENAGGERYTVTEIANGSSVRKGTIRMRHVLHKDDYPSTEFWRERYVHGHWRKVIPNKSVEPAQPPLLKAGDPCPRFLEHGRLREWGDGLYCYGCQAWYRPDTLQRWAADDAQRFNAVEPSPAHARELCEGLASASLVDEVGVLRDWLARRGLRLVQVGQGQAPEPEPAQPNPEADRLWAKTMTDAAVLANAAGLLLEKLTEADGSSIDRAMQGLRDALNRYRGKAAAEGDAKADPTPTDTASEDEIMGREFDSLRPGDVIENAGGERYTVTEIANGSSVRKGTIRMRHVLHKDDYPSSEFWRERYVYGHFRKVVPSKPEEPKQPPLQWVEWKEGMVIEEGLYPVVLAGESWTSTRKFRDDQWRYADGIPCCPRDRISRYLPIRLPDPFVTQS